MKDLKPWWIRARNNIAVALGVLQGHDELEHGAQDRAGRPRRPITLRKTTDYLSAEFCHSVLIGRCS